MSTGTIHFLLNNEQVALENIDPNLTVLQYLRNERFITGTKEGCASGDCGACTVVVAQLSSTDVSSTNVSATNTHQLSYKSINSCITFVGSLHRKQLITVEHLKEGSKLHHIQQSMVDHHGSQCGFCTPGFVMSAFALHKQNHSPDREEVIEALAGNLCRCTGYRSIIDAAMESSKEAAEDSFARHYLQTVEQLIELNKLPALQFSGANKEYFAPESCDELAQYLLEKPASTLVAGGTDLALLVTQNLSTIEQLVYLGDVAELNSLRENADEIIIGSAVPYSLFTPLLDKEYPEMSGMIGRIGSRQVRNNGTLGGNIGNASPIGDMPPALIALGAKMTMQCGEKLRKIAVEDYFISYRQTVLAESEFIKEIFIPKPHSGQVLKLYKISKRFDDDISAVLAAIFIELENNCVKTLRIAFGGMAEIPKRAKYCEIALLGKTFIQENVAAAQQELTKDFQPMSDVRASNLYRMKVAQNLIQKCYLELTSKNIETRVVTYA